MLVATMVTVVVAFCSAYFSIVAMFSILRSTPTFGKPDTYAWPSRARVRDQESVVTRSRCSERGLHTGSPTRKNKKYDSAFSADVSRRNFGTPKFRHLVCSSVLPKMREGRVFDMPFSLFYYTLLI